MKTCTKCKIEKPKSDFSMAARYRDGLQQRCKACNADYRAANREAIRSCNAARYIAKKEEKIEYQSAYYEANKHAILAQKADYRLKNKEIIRESKSIYHAANKKYQLEKMSRNYRANKEKYLERARNRRARIRSAEGTHTAADIRPILHGQRGLCANCHSKLFKSGKQKFHVDHIVPLARGGSNWPDNLQCLCPSCNLSKGAKDPLEWAAQNGRLF